MDMAIQVKCRKNTEVSWDFDVEAINVQEKVEWLENKTNDRIEIDPSWMIIGERQCSIENEHQFCQPQLLCKLLEAKNVFEELDSTQLGKARARANPFETIKSAIFMNRAALKIANIDAATDFMFSDIDRNPNHRKIKGPYYFADICAGPGGFSEYMFWRKSWLFKGFGLTLRGKNDFKIKESSLVSGAMFQGLYGVHDDGNACCPENVEDFTNKVKHQTENQGVHFTMGDGGFSVEGNENLQEILSKPLYVAQCFIALSIVRTNGHFVTKLFDLLTPFSVALIYLMYKCFEKVAVFKPNASRPANAERYFICYGLKPEHEIAPIRSYLRKICEKLWELKDLTNNMDVKGILPVSLIKSDKTFTTYITNSNIRLAQKQVLGLLKFATFCRDPTLLDPKQEELRQQCLSYWRIPDTFTLKSISSNMNVLEPLDLIKMHVSKPAFIYSKCTRIKKLDELSIFLSQIKNWNCTFVSNRYAGNILVCLGSSTYRLQDKKWVKVKKLYLVKGSILYGEMLSENQISKNQKQNFRVSLHIIDALRLGDTSLADLCYKERMDLIQTYCEAVNQETGANSTIRIRPKIVKPLSAITSFNTDLHLLSNRCHLSLPRLGFQSRMETYAPTSLLLFKTGEDESFNTTFILRLMFDFQQNSKDENVVSDFKYNFNNFINYIEHMF